MTAISIHVNVLVGTSCTTTSQEAITLANKLGVTVTFDFNGVKCLAVPGDCPLSLAEDCLREVGRSSNCKIARATKKAKPIGDGFSG